MNTRPLSEQVVIITGASSGIGRETALQFARRGARVVAAARNEEGLNTLVDEISRGGGEALAVATDVSVWEDVRELSRRALDRFGRVDTWINNAAVAMYAPFEETSPEEFRRIVDVNLMGQVYGTMAALAAMPRGREEAGVIINNASVLAERAVPLQSAYCAAKHGVKGFTEALRMELAHDRRNVAVCIVEPSSMDTPLFEHARSKTGRQAKPLPPVYDPALVAQAMLACAERPQPLVVVGGAGKLLTTVEDVAGPLLDAWMERTAYRQQQANRPAPGRDNLFQPIREPGKVHGGFGGRRFSTYTWARLHPRAALAGLAGAAVAVPVAIRLRNSAQGAPTPSGQRPPRRR